VSRTSVSTGFGADDGTAIARVAKVRTRENNILEDLDGIVWTVCLQIVLNRRGIRRIFVCCVD
jgi:hypothetical protein